MISSYTNWKCCNYVESPPPDYLPRMVYWLHMNTLVCMISCAHMEPPLNLNMQQHSWRFVCTSWIIVLNLCSCFISKSISTPTSYLGPYLCVYHIEHKLLISPSQLINMKNWTMQLSQCHYMGQSSSKAIIFSYWTVLEIIVPCTNGTSTNSVSTLFKSYTSSEEFCTGRPFHYYLTRFFEWLSTRTVKESIVLYFGWSATFNSHANGFGPINLHRIHTQDPLKEIDYF